MSPALIEELAGTWEVMAEMEEAAKPGRRETLRECADALRMLLSISAGKPSGQDAIDAAMLDALKACEQFLRVLGLDSKPAAEVAEKARAALAAREAGK